MRILFIGDIVGTPGVNFVRKAVPELIRRERLDLVIANAENAAGGSGLTPRLYRRLRDAGVDLMTLGDHIYKKVEIIDTLRSEERLCKPANFPPLLPGCECSVCPRPRRHACGRLLRPGPDVHAGRRLPLSRRRPRAVRHRSDRPASSSSTPTPRRPPTSICSAITSRDASVRCSGRTRTCRRPTSKSCPAAPRSSATWA